MICFVVLWNTYGECNNYLIFTGGHKEAVLDTQYSASGAQIYSASADKTVIMWDTATGAKIKKLKGHQNIVNALTASHQEDKILGSVSDDKTIRIWDARKNTGVATIKEDYQLTAVTFNETNDQIIVAGIENLLKVYDLRKNALLYTMAGHFDTVTGLALSPDGNYVLSNSMDNSSKFCFALTSLKLNLHSFPSNSVHLGHSAVCSIGSMHQNTHRPSAQF